MDADRFSVLARAWDEAAREYERYFVPRFAPWVSAAVDALAGELPDGPIVVPCCGTFPELPALLRAYPEREIVGVDLSAGMLELARERAAGHPRVSLVQGDATALGGEHAGLVSVFGLQQLPDPAAALANWVGALRTGGLLSVMFWPYRVEEEGPFALLDRVLEGERSKAGPDWEAGLADVVAGAGGALLRDEVTAYPMSHPDPETLWTAMTTGGSLRAMALRRGEAGMRPLRAEFLRLAPAGEWRHRPRARWIVARRS
ncbi:MAG: class I SAM-dependent methyltransferase [Micromonosporaceae bacterium]